MGRIDLDARIASGRTAARAEARAEPKIFVFRGREWTCVVERATLEYFELINDIYALGPLEETEDTVKDPRIFGMVSRGLQIFLGPDQYGRLKSLSPEGDELIAILEAINELYGVGLPESPASNGSRGSTGRRSRPTSKRSTAST